MPLASTAECITYLKQYAASAEENAMLLYRTMVECRNVCVLVYKSRVISSSALMVLQWHAT